MAKEKKIRREREVESTPDDAPRKSGRAWIGIVGGVLFGINVVAGLVLAYLTIGAGNEEEAAEVPEVINVTAAMENADQLLLSGRTEEALQQYQLAEQAESPVPPELTYRIAVCAEELSDSEEALRNYRMISRVRSSEVALAGRLGQARIHYAQGAYATCRRVLAPAAKLSADPAYSLTTLGGDVNYLLGLALAQETREAKSESLLDATHLFGPQIRWDVGDVLSLVPIDASTNPVAGAMADDFVRELETIGDPEKPATILVSANLQQRSIGQIIDAIVAETGWQADLTEMAEDVTRARRASLNVRDRTAAEVLSLLLEPHELFWTFEDQTLRVQRVQDVEPEVVTARNLKRANELLEVALAEAPEHKLASQAYLALGNLAGHVGRVERAAAFFREIADRFPGSETTQTATFNLAKVHFIQRDRVAAIPTFFEVVDGRTGAELEPLAYLYIGRLQLDDGQFEAARKALGRSLAMARHTDVRAGASITLAAAYLISRDDDSPEAANAALMEARSDLRQDRYRNIAVFLSALTRFRATVRPKELGRRGDELLAAAARVDPAKFFGRYGYMLLGDAFADLNITSETIRQYQLGMHVTRGTRMYDALMYRLANEYRRQDQLEESRLTFLELAASESVEWAARGLVEAASLMLTMGRFEECRTHCRWALERSVKEDYPQEARAALLRTLGRVYEESGDFRRAGLCYAGFLPSEDLVVGAK